MEVSSSEGWMLVEVFSMRLVPFSAYSRKRFSPATPIEEVRFRSIMSDLSVEKMIISYRARETATFNRLSPPRTVQRTEVHADAPFGIGTIADGEQYHIPFVSLHIFKVLDEQGFFTFQRKGFQFGVEDEEIG